MAEKYAHAIVAATDIEMSIALGHPITAVCGLTFVPTLYGEAELRGRPDCPACHPPMKKTKGKAGKGRGPKLKDSRHLPHYVYRCYDEGGRLIYVGCTVNPIARLRSHRKHSWWADQMASHRLIVFPNRECALEKEAEAIGEENPRWNIRHRNRSRLSVDDYIDLRTAVVNSAESIRSGRSSHVTDRTLADIDAALRELGVTPMSSRRPA